MFNGVSNFVESVDSAFLFILLVSLFFLVLITTLMIVFVIKYNRKKNVKAKNIHGNIPLEIAWTVIPTILVLIMFWFGWTGYKDMSAIPDDAFEVTVTAQMWKWSFKYENGVTSDSLYIPLKKPIKVFLTSLDVNHSFYIPEFRVKKDVLPNRKNTAWFIAEKAGDYDIFCAEYCGLNHSYMLNKVIVMPVNDFNKWMNKKVAEMNTPADTSKINQTQADTLKTNT